MSQIRQSKGLKRGTCLLSSADRKVLFVRKRESVLGESVIAHYLFSSFEECHSYPHTRFCPSHRVKYCLISTDLSSCHLGEVSQSHRRENVAVLYLQYTHLSMYLWIPDKANRSFFILV